MRPDYHTRRKSESTHLSGSFVQSSAMGRNQYTHQTDALQAKFSQQVLYDTIRMFRGNQDQKIGQCLQQGPTRIKEMKNQKVVADMDLMNKLQCYKKNLGDFFQHKKISMVTEQ